MITKWMLSNFKSVRSAELEFTPLTIFSGPNSSGKSTSLQSLLLIVQTLSSKISSHSVVLNGPIMRLGQFSDLASSNSGSARIDIAWECRPQNEHSRDFHLPPSTLGTVAYWGQQTEIQLVKCAVSFEVDQHGSASELTQLQPTLSHCRIDCSTGSDPQSALTSWIDVSRSKLAVAGPHGKAAKMQIGEDVAGALGFEYDVSLDPESQREIRDELTSGHTVGASLRHFLPIQLAVRFSVQEEEASLMRSALLEDQRRLRHRYYYTRDAVFPDSVLEVLEGNLSEVAPQLFEAQPAQTERQQRLIKAGLSVRQFTDRLRRTPVSRQSEVRKRLANLAPELSKLIDTTVTASRPKQFSLTPVPVTTPLSAAISYLDSFFSRNVRYLGPLRDEPKPLYPLAGTVDPTDVGFRGEHTAAVLHLHRDQGITYIPSSNFAAPQIDPRPTFVTLAEAVQDWAVYMGVADGFQTRDLGKLGHELKVLSEGVSAPQDLTHVGVGVSQVLPILVLCLLAQEDTTIIIEQPELHLHPRVQTLLADFFLSMAMLRKQCIIESHSEYIINRLRLRAATAAHDTVSSLLKIYFVQKTAGSSQFRDVVVSEYGSIPQWPEGFFDQSQAEAESILLAATKKRRTGRVDP